MVQAAKTPSVYLSGFHVFMLANAFRRPILVYSDPLVRGSSGDAVGICDIGG